MHFAFAVAHGAQAAPHLAVGTFGRSALELLVVNNEASAVPASIVCHRLNSFPTLSYASNQKRVHGLRRLCEAGESEVRRAFDLKGCQRPSLDWPSKPQWLNRCNLGTAFCKKSGL
jgi:hypothetical protein